MKGPGEFVKEDTLWSSPILAVVSEHVGVRGETRHWRGVPSLGSLLVSQGESWLISQVPRTPRTKLLRAAIQGPFRE